MGKRKRMRKELIRLGREDLVHRSPVPPTTDEIFQSLFHPGRLHLRTPEGAGGHSEAVPGKQPVKDGVAL